ncbi:MAG: metal-dependent hydrolase [Nanoarchaeota archaeon]|nr:metal-dependent hydrolase [Nanoarchaeota archaeon]
MFIKTHLAITFFGIVIFLDFFHGIENKLLFLGVAFLATFIPDVDTRFSKLGKRKVFRPIQFFFGHRGFIHSFTFLAIIFVFLLFLNEVIAFGFLLGYGLHLFADSFTKFGVYLLWPIKKNFKGPIKTGGKFERLIFTICLVVGFFLLGLKVFR